MSDMADLTMADLTDGLPVRHLTWLTTGTVCTGNGWTSVRWDGVVPVEEPVGDGEQLRPWDLEIIGSES